MREYHIYTINLEEADGSILPWDTLQVKNGCVTAYCRQSGPPLAVVTDRNLPRRGPHPAAQALGSVT